MVVYRRPASSKRGVRVVTTREAGMRWPQAVALDERNSRDGEIVWSWHPGADAQRNALARCRDTGAREPVPGEITYKR